MDSFKAAKSASQGGSVSDFGASAPPSWASCAQAPRSEREDSPSHAVDVVEFAGASGGTANAASIELTRVGLRSVATSLAWLVTLVAALGSTWTPEINRPTGPSIRLR